MNLFEVIKVSINALVSNKMRSVLTMLGVIIGVAAVIALVSLGQGAQTAVEAQITGLGTNLITVNTQGSARLTAEDVASILNRVPTVSMATPVITQPVTAKARNSTYDTSFSGVSEKFAEIRNYSLERGRLFDEQEVTSRRKVAVIGYTVYRELFGERAAVGESINLKGQTFTVIGICAPKGSTMGQDSDDMVFIPYTTAQRLIGTRYVSTVIFKAESSDVASATSGHITRILEEKFRNASRAQESATGRRVDPFHVFSQDELLNTVGQMTGTFTVLLAGIAAVSLLVGGIGIMNIMLVSVTERTREIGIRKAIGAKNSDVLTQFLVESVVISASGGVIGILTGSSLARFVGSFNNMGVVVSPLAVAVAFSFATAVGMFFGIYPAVKASNLDPIVALRYE
jgi:putative ABC transport system permease protein